MREFFGNKLLELAKKDKRVYVLDGDLANSVKTDKVAKEMPHKFLQMGIAEQNMVGVAAGLATIGLQPWVSTFTSFLTKRALDQIIVSVAQPSLDVKMVGSYSGLLNGKVGKTHQGIEDIALMRVIPNMVILSPRDGEELTQMMDWANKYNGPVYIRIVRELKKSIFTDEYKFENPINSILLKEGKDISIISTGTHTSFSLQASEQLEKEGISAELIHIPSIKPIDKYAIIKSASKTKKVLTVEDHSIIGGLGSAVAEIIVENIPCYMRRIGIRDKNIEAGTNEELLDKYEMSVDHIVNMAKILKNK